MKYKCLVLDHDDTVVNSTASIHFPSFVKYLEEYRPEIAGNYTLNDYLEKNDLARNVTFYFIAIGDEAEPFGRYFAGDEHFFKVDDCENIGDKIDFVTRLTIAETTTVTGDAIGYGHSYDDKDDDEDDDNYSDDDDDGDDDDAPVVNDDSDDDEDDSNDDNSNGKNGMGNLDEEDEDEDKDDDGSLDAILDF